jgi:hypothetical protein
VKRSTSTIAQYNTGGSNPSVPSVAPTTGDGNLKIGSSDGAALSKAVFSFAFVGGGLTNIQVDDLGNRILAWRAGLATLGL